MKFIKSLFVLLMVALLLIATVACGTNPPETPDQPPENGSGDNQENTEPIVDTHDYSEELTQEYNKSLEQLGTVLEESDFSDSFSMKNLVKQFSELDMKLVPVESDASTFLQIKDGVLYVAGETEQTDENGNTVQIPTSQLFKLYENGIASIQTANGQSSVSVIPISIETSSLNYVWLVNSLHLTEKDLVAEPQTQTYKLSDEYVKKLSDALEDVISSANKDLEDSFDVSLSDIQIDLSRWKSENTALITMKVGKEKDLMTVTVVQSKGENGAKSAEITMTCADRLSAKATLVLQGDTVTELSMVADSVKLGLHAELESKVGEAFSIKLTVKNENDPAELLSISLSTVILQDGEQKSVLKMAIPASLMAESGAELDYAPTAFELLELQAEIASKKAENGESDYTVDLAVWLDKQDLFGAELSYLASLERVPGKTFLNATLKLAGGENPAEYQKIVLSATTVAWSENAFEYDLDAGVEIAAVDPATGKIITQAHGGKAKLIGPSLEELPLSETETTYLERCDQLFKYYPSIEVEINKINQNAIAFLQSGFTENTPTSYCVKGNTGMYYYTDFVVKNGMVNVYTNCVIDYEKEAYWRATTDRDFTNYTRSRADQIHGEVVETYSIGLSDHLYQPPVRPIVLVTYVTEMDAYLIYDPLDEAEPLRYVAQKPTEESFPDRFLHWYTLGSGLLHTYESGISDDCYKIFVCEECGIGYHDGRDHQNTWTFYQEDYGEARLDSYFIHCSRCHEAYVEFSDYYRIRLTFTLAELNDAHMERLKQAGITLDFPREEGVTYLVIESMNVTNGNMIEDLRIPWDVVIPDVSGETDCKIIGSFAVWDAALINGEFKVEYPEGILFVNDTVGAADPNRLIFPDSLQYDLTVKS